MPAPVIRTTGNARPYVERRGYADRSRFSSRWAGARAHVNFDNFIRGYCLAITVGVVVCGFFGG